jgi:hypothetical protein
MRVLPGKGGLLLLHYAASGIRDNPYFLINVEVLSVYGLQDCIAKP